MTQEPSGSRPTITHQLLQVVQLSPNSRFDRYLVPVLLAVGSGYSLVQFLTGDWIASGISALSVILLLVLAILKPLQNFILHRPFDRNHAYWVATFWVYSLLWIWVYRQVAVLPSTGKQSESFYVFVLLFIAITFRTIGTLFALTPRGYDMFISRIPIWERILVAVNEFIAAALLAFVAGGALARLLQPRLFTVYTDPTYLGLLLSLLGTYYFMVQLMWLRSINEWLSKNNVWVSLARLLAPIALLVATLVIVRHFTRLSDARTADLLGTADLDQTVLALSPILWLMIFFVVLLVYTGNRGLKQRFLPDQLTKHLPLRLQNFLATVSDMDILLLFGLLCTSIPLHAVLFDDETFGLLDFLRRQIELQNALIDSSKQALAVLFALPFYILCALLLALYAWVLANPVVTAEERDELVNRLPMSQLIILIITLYLCAVPFSLVLTEGRIPQLPQELGRVLAFDILIPLLLLYGHYFALVRIPYGRGQTRWRVQRSTQLERELKRTDQLMEEIHNKLRRTENMWGMRRHLRANEDEKIDMLYEFIHLNSERDHLNMERLRIVTARQELAEISEEPISFTITRLPTRVIGLGIPLLLAFKIYEWAIVNDGLREIANNPNISVIEFFQTILRQAQF